MGSSGYTLTRSEDLPSEEPENILRLQQDEMTFAAGEWKCCLGGMLVLALAYLLLQNGHWIPGTDTSFYISVSRNVAMGKGFVFNGGPVGKIPPLWPATLALAMRISTSFWFLNMIPTVALIAAAGFWYWVLRRLASPIKCFWSVVLSGLLLFCYTGAIQLRTEAMFCLAFAPSLLLAMQIAEGRPIAWRLPLMLTLVAMAVGVRWAGAVTAFVVGAAAISRPRQGAWNRRWTTLALIAVVAAGSFAGCRLLLKYVFPPPVMEWTDAEDRRGRHLGEDTDFIASSGPEMQKIFGEKGIRMMAQSLANSGKWVSSLFWFPLYLGVTNSKVGIFTNIFGWALILLCWYQAWFDARSRRQWIWIGVILYCAAMIVRCRVPNPRYLVPVAPLLLLAVWLALERLAASLRGARWQRMIAFCIPAFLCSIALCNVALWGIDVYIFRSPQFYGRYRAGEVDKLIAAARNLVAKGAGNKEIAVSLYYVNLGREKPRPNGEGLRSMNMLSNLLIRSVPDNVCIAEPNDKLLRWAAHKKPAVRYYLYRPEVSPWRALHFRIGWLQKRLQHRDNIPNNPSWVLYDLSNGKAVQIELPDVLDWPTHVPGMAAR
jgi:hypothetical protein